MAISTLMKKVSMAAAEVAFDGFNALMPNAPQALTFVTNRADLGANDSVNWGVLGDESTSVLSTFKITSANDLNLTVSCPGTFLRVDEGSRVHGNFAQGDKLLFSKSPDGAITIDLGTPVLGVGTQIQAALFGAFTGVMEVFDSNGRSLAIFSLSGKSNDAADNSAIFLGILSNAANISRLKLYVPENDGYGFTINKLDLVTPVDEPTPASRLLVFDAKGFGYALSNYSTYTYMAA